MDLHNEKFLEKILTNLSYPEPETRSSEGRRMYLVATRWLFRHIKGETCSCGPSIVAKEDICLAAQFYIEHVVVRDAIVV